MGDTPSLDCDDLPTLSVSASASASASAMHPSPVFKPRSHRNLKKLSLMIPATPTASGPATASLVPPENRFSSHPQPHVVLHPPPHPIRRASIVSLPPVSTAALYRKDEAESPSAPYRDGPIEVMPSVWIGDEDNARDWKRLRERGIKSILNVAKELPCPLRHHPNPLRGAQSTSNLDTNRRDRPESTYYPAHLPSGRPAFHYLKLPWSHGQADLVKDGFPAAMLFVDGALARGDGVLIQ
jgi:tyrosine-protein phosphatase